jgi:hypothetical protein
MIKNLLETGTPFYYSADDKNYADLLNSEIEDCIEVNNSDSYLDMEFEDEI